MLSVFSLQISAHPHCDSLSLCKGPPQLLPAVSVPSSSSSGSAFRQILTAHGCHQLLGGESSTKECLRDLRGVKRINQARESRCEEEEILWAVGCAGARCGAVRAHIPTRPHGSDPPQTIPGAFTLARTQISSLFVKSCNGKEGPIICHVHMWGAAHPASKRADLSNRFVPWSPIPELPSHGFE